MDFVISIPTSYRFLSFRNKYKFIFSMQIIPRNFNYAICEYITEKYAFSSAEHICTDILLKVICNFLPFGYNCKELCAATFRPLKCTLF